MAKESASAKRRREKNEKKEAKEAEEAAPVVVAAEVPVEDVAEDVALPEAVERERQRVLYHERERKKEEDELMYARGDGRRSPAQVLTSAEKRKLTMGNKKRRYDADENKSKSEEEEDDTEGEEDGEGKSVDWWDRSFRQEYVMDKSALLKFLNKSIGTTSSPTRDSNLGGEMDMSAEKDHVPVEEEEEKSGWDVEGKGPAATIPAATVPVFDIFKPASKPVVSWIFRNCLRWILKVKCGLLAKPNSNKPENSIQWDLTQQNFVVCLHCSRLPTSTFKKVVYWGDCGSLIGHFKSRDCGLKAPVEWKQSAGDKPRWQPTVARPILKDNCKPGEDYIQIQFPGTDLNYASKIKFKWHSGSRESGPRWFVIQQTLSSTLDPKAPICDATVDDLLTERSPNKNMRVWMGKKMVKVQKEVAKLKAIDAAKAAAKAAMEAAQAQSLAAGEGESEDSDDED
ncbi:hypothetical protein B484DRAFT_406433 [Ochromonadaceae sp. CCMP2298]|nr:hypothetical protein B484DRAFT_406433 [Ochromonadaceae sp. CCMP2298]